ncbi:MAG: exo-alpha-sialidase, partial [Saprospirales bacterium]|nr:exo-alpha-sialidase [Saprospirales bacterium]
NIVFRSADGGQTWQDVSAGLPGDLQVRGVFAGGDEVLLGAESGVYRSNTAPVAPIWEKALFLNENITAIFPGRAGPYACSYWNGFFQEILPGIWEPVHTAMKDKMVHTVLETPDGTVFVGCDSGIFKSADGGKTWKQVFAEGMVTSLVASDDVLVGGGFRGVLRSTDGGEHWGWVLTEDGMALKTGRIGGNFVAITSGFGPPGAETTHPVGLAANRLRSSTDGGKTWQRMDESLSAALFSPALSIKNMDARWSGLPRAINDIEQVGEYLFCSLEAGVFRSADQGKTWTLVLPSYDGKSFEMTKLGNVIFAVSINAGC